MYINQLTIKGMILLSCPIEKYLLLCLGGIRSLDVPY